MSASGPTPPTDIARRLMPRRMLLTASAAAVLSLLALVYSAVLNLLVRVPVVESGAGAPAIPHYVQPPLAAKEMANRWLSSERWIVEGKGAKYQLRTDQAFVYFEDWEHVDGDEAVRFRPFAMIYLQSGRKEDEPPITVVSKSAYVRFARKFDATNPDPGRVTFGSLEGEVRIAGPDGMQIVGRNFTYEEQAMKVHSDNSLRFAHGPHRGTAHGLELILEPDLEALKQDKLAVKGVRQVQLRQNVVMDLVQERKTPDGAVDPSGKPDEVHIQSDGRFTFDVSTNVATFEKNVHVLHPTRPGKYDTLECDLLTLYFEPEEGAEGEQPAVAESESAALPGGDAGAPEAAGAEPGEERFQSIGGDLQFRRMQADGRSVVLVSQANQLKATMHQLTYDARTRVANLVARDSVKVHQQASEMRCPQVTLVHDSEGEVTRSVCLGAGALRQVSRETGKLEFAARWRDRLHMYPDSRTKLDIVELIGEAVVQQPEQETVLAAQHMLKIWVERQEGEAAEAEDRSGEFRPKRMLALSSDPDAGPSSLRGVAITSPEITARGKRLEIWFEPIPGTPDVEPVPLSERRPRDRLTPAVQRVSWDVADAGTRPVSMARQDAAAPGPVLPGLASSTVESSAGRREEDVEPIHVTADLIRARVLLTENDRRRSQISQIWTDGDVHVEQPHANGEPPLVIDCERLHVQARGEHDHILDIYGRAPESSGPPAHIRDRGTHIEGYTIHLDRGQNFASVKGAGLLQLPVRETLEGEKLPEPRLLDIWWKDEMTFNGTTAMFYGEVRAVLDESTLHCEEMDVLLTERISFVESRRAPGRDSAKVREVFCRDGVRFDGVAYDEQGVLVEVRRGEFAEMSLNQETGDTVAMGPGTIRVWQRKDPQQAAAAPTASVRANRGLQSDASEWNYLWIEFAKTAEGNTKRRTTQFSDRVSVLYGPVERPPLTFTLEDKPADAGWLACETLDVTHHEKTADAAAYAEFLAQGNAQVEGRAFQGRADTISYDQSKDLYVLRSLAPRQAVLWHQSRPGQKASEARAQTMTFIPSQNHLNFAGTTGVDGIR